MVRFLSACLLLVIALCGCRPPAAPPAPAPPDSSGAATAGFPLTLTDDVGQTVTLSAAPRRIVSMAPSLTEILFALGLGDRLVGVTTFCKYPPEAQKIEKIGGYIDASEEKILALAPDLVVATRGTPRTFMDSLRGQGLHVLAVDQTTWAQVEGSIRLLGKACGATTEAEKIVGEMNAARATVEARTGAIPAAERPRALLVISLQPLFAGGPGSFQHEMLNAAGARDVSGLQKPFGGLSEEGVIAADPQVLIFTSIDNGVPVTKAGQLKRLRASAAWRHTAAVKQERIVIVNVDHFSVPGPRLAWGLRELAAQLHPELFPQP
jgi:iron complex transport system substrate-binding protein